MKSLLDIQQDIRNLENSVRSITESIRNIGSDIDNIRNSSEASGGLALDFTKIETLAKRLSFGIHPLSSLGQDEVCRTYLRALLNIVRLDTDEKTTVSRMVFIQWLQMQSHIEFSLEELYKDSFKFDEQLYYDLVDNLPEDYREYFIVDALIIANISGAANKDIYEYIAQLTALLGISADNMKTLASISKMILCQNVKGYNREQLMLLDEKYRYYMSNKGSVLSDIRIGLRVVAVEFKAANSLENFKWCVGQHEKVKKGDVVAEIATLNPNALFPSLTGNRTAKDNRFIKTDLKAPVSGTIFQFSYNNTFYGVISSADDDMEDIKNIKNWVKEKKR